MQCVCSNQDYVVNVLATNVSLTYSIKNSTGFQVSSGSIQPFQMGEYNTSSTSSYYIVASNPLLVAHISHTNDADCTGCTNGDPSMVFPPPLDRTDLLSSDYRFVTPQVSNFINIYYSTTAYTDYSNFLNIIISSTETSGLVMDGTSVTATWAVFISSSYSVAQIPVSPGTHSIYHSTGVKFAAYLYGNTYQEAYATPVTPWNSTTYAISCGQTTTRQPTTTTVPPTTTTVPPTTSTVAPTTTTVQPTTTVRPTTTTVSPTTTVQPTTTIVTTTTKSPSNSN